MEQKQIEWLREDVFKGLISKLIRGHKFANNGVSPSKVVIPYIPEVNGIMIEYAAVEEMLAIDEQVTVQQAIGEEETIQQREDETADLQLELDTASEEPEDVQ